MKIEDERQNIDEKRAKKLKKTDIIALLLIISTVGLSFYYIFSITAIDGEILQKEKTIELFDQFWIRINEFDESTLSDLIRIDKLANESVTNGIMTETEANVTLSSYYYQHYHNMVTFSVIVYTFDEESLELLSPGITEVMFRGDEPMLEFVFFADVSNSHYIYDNYTLVNMSTCQFGWSDWKYEHSEAIFEQSYTGWAFTAWSYPTLYNKYKTENLVNPLNQLNAQKDAILISIEANTLAIVIMGFALDVHKFVKSSSLILAVIFLIVSLFYGVILV